MGFLLTDSGREKARAFIAECEAFRKELLDAHIDTADDTNLPNLTDIEDDISLTELDADTGDYYNCWGVTDNYDSSVLSLEGGVDFVDRDDFGKRLSAELDKLVDTVDESCVCTDYSEEFLMWIDVPRELKHLVYRYVGYTEEDIAVLAPRRYDETDSFELAYHPDNDEILGSVLGMDSRESFVISDYAKFRLRPIFRMCLSA